MKESQHTTIQELRECPEFAHLDDVTAQNVIDSIREFCAIIACQHNSFSNEPEIEICADYS